MAKDGFVHGATNTLIIDIDNIQKGIKDYENYVKAVEVGLANGIVELAERLKAKMMEYLNSYGLGNSKIASQLFYEISEDGILIGSKSEYAVFVEYGTGLAGLNSPHPQPKGWQYNVGETIRPNGGWWYPTTADDPNPHKRVFNGELYAWTIQGQESRPFLYYTWLWGSRSATQIIRKNINREIKKLR